MTSLYTENVRKFITDYGVHSIVDIGCGDFRVSSKLLSSDVTYTGLDIVSSLIDRNNETFGSDRIGFRCINAVDEPLPAADLCLIRQVLQHLSNAQIAAILSKLGVYKYVLISEHHPALLTMPNKDKMPGSSIRIPAGSGVYLDAPPFAMENARIHFKTPLGNGEQISTYLVARDSSG